MATFCTISTQKIKIVIDEYKNAAKINDIKIYNIKQRKREQELRVKSYITPTYGFAGVVSVLNLSLTPYNLQLLTPHTHMDAYATLTIISALVFSLVVVALLSAAISAHVLIISYQDKMIGTIVSSVEVVFATIFASLSVTFNWSSQICLIVLTTLLIACYVLNIFEKKSEENKLRLADIKINWLWLGIIVAVSILAIIAVLTSSALIVERAISFK